MKSHTHNVEKSQTAKKTYSKFLMTQNFLKKAILTSSVRGQESSHPGGMGVNGRGPEGHTWGSGYALILNLSSYTGVLRL